MFDLTLYPKPNIHREVIDGKRHYVCNDWVYPSVTTLIGEYYDDSALVQWQNRIGKENADAITHRAGVRGTRLHNICEKYLLNEEGYLRGQMPSALADFQNVKRLLDSNVREIYGVEFPLYSDRLKAAGTTDLACRWKDKRSVVDFKTSRKEKKAEWIEHYFVQSSAYAIMLNELFGLDIEQVVILVLPENAPISEFVRNVDDYGDKVNEVFIRNRPVGFDARRWISASADHGAVY